METLFPTPARYSITPSFICACYRSSRCDLFVLEHVLIVATFVVSFYVPINFLIVYMSLSHLFFSFIQY